MEPQLDLPEEIFSEMHLHEKHGQKKSHGAKRRERVEKLYAAFMDPERRRKERKRLRMRNKQKIDSQTENMTSEQKGEYIKKLKEEKLKAKQKVFDCMKTGFHVYIDMAYEEVMNLKENKSLLVQIELIYKALLKVENPCSLHLCSLGETARERLEKMRYQFWAITSHSEDIVQVAKSNNKKVVYLSPDAEQELEEVRDDTAYVIGGLVDRTILKNASLQRAQLLGVEARKLPIGEMMVNRKCLNLDHVVMILCKQLECKNWAEAFEYGAPKRFKKQQEEGNAKEKKEAGKEKQQGEESSEEGESDGNDEDSSLSSGEQQEIREEKQEEIKS